MRRIPLVLIFLMTVFSCSDTATSQKQNAENKNTSRTAEKNDAKRFAGLEKQCEQIASAARGKVGVKVEILETGESASLNAGERFPMQSVYKLPIGMAVLHQVDKGKIKLDQSVTVEKSDFVRRGMYSPIRDKNPNGTRMSVRELLRFAVSESDGTASDVLLDLVGVEAVGSYLVEIGVKNITIADSEKQIGRDWETQYRNWSSPDGAIELLRALHEKRGGMSQENQALLLKFMVESPRGQKRLKGFLPGGAIVAHKTGTSGTRDGVTAATNDIGIITLPDGRHLAIAVFVSDSPADEKTREEVIAKIARAAWDASGKTNGGTQFENGTVNNYKNGS